MVASRRTLERPILAAAPQALHQGRDSTPLTACPCGVCPVLHDCTEEGPISPNTCTYYREWLDF